MMGPAGEIRFGVPVSPASSASGMNNNKERTANRCKLTLGDAVGIDQVLVVGTRTCRPVRHFDGPRLLHGQHDQAGEDGRVARQGVSVAGVHLQGSNYSCADSRAETDKLKFDTYHLHTQVNGYKRRTSFIPERMMIGGLRSAPVAVLARHLYSAEWTS
jgi:hypothetical protein